MNTLMIHDATPEQWLDLCMAYRPTDLPEVGSKVIHAQLGDLQVSVFMPSELKGKTDADISVTS